MICCAEIAGSDTFCIALNAATAPGTPSLALRIPASFFVVTLPIWAKLLTPLDHAVINQKRSWLLALSRLAAASQRRSHRPRSAGHDGAGVLPADRVRRVPDIRVPAGNVGRRILSLHHKLLPVRRSDLSHVARAAFLPRLVQPRDLYVISRG